MRILENRLRILAAQSDFADRREIHEDHDDDRHDACDAEHPSHVDNHEILGCRRHVQECIVIHEAYNDGQHQQYECREKTNGLSCESVDCLVPVFFILSKM